MRRKQKEMICVLCGRAWEPAIKNLCECGGFCTWGYELNKPLSYHKNENGNWVPNPPPANPDLDA